MWDKAFTKEVAGKLDDNGRLNSVNTLRGLKLNNYVLLMSMGGGLQEKIIQIIHFTEHLAVCHRISTTSCSKSCYQILGQGKGSL